MNFLLDLWPSKGSVVLVWYVSSMCMVHMLVTGTSVQSWQHLLNHPHYADDGHQHAHHVTTPRPRNTRLEDVQTVSTEFPSTRSTGTTRTPWTPTAVVHVQSSVSSRTYYTPSRSPSAKPKDEHRTANIHNSSTHAKELSSSTPSAAGQNRISTSKGPTLGSTPAARSRAYEVTFPPKDYYNVNGLPDGFHSNRKSLESAASPTKEKIFASIKTEMENVRQANEHFMKIREEGRCKTPRAQLFRVKDVYPDPAKEYLPRCTILHRCNDQSGCCDAEGFQCMPKAIQEVALSFYVIHIDKESQRPDFTESVTKLLFDNHTECECLLVDDQPKITEKPLKSQQNDHHHQQHHPVDPNIIQNHPSKCQECPLPFCKREYPDGRCACDCFDRQRPCLRIKRGREPMQESERRCVETGKCHIPECEYGTFDATLGRCPKRPEDHHRRNNHHHNKNHRWTFFERD